MNQVLSFKPDSAAFALRFSNVGIAYYRLPSWCGGKAFHALSGIDLCIENQSIAIVGPSGAGKSTLIELLFGLKKPTTGKIECLVNGHVLTDDNAITNLMRRIQLVPQEPHTSLNPFYTVKQILSEPLNHFSVDGSVHAHVEQTLADVGLSLSVLPLKPKQLSTGQAQRVAIARAIITRPAILVADEPTSSLDPVNRQKILTLLTSLKKRHQMRLLIITHDIDAAATLCDEIAVLHQGKIVEQRATKQMLSASTHPISQALMQAQGGLLSSYSLLSTHIA